MQDVLRIYGSPEPMPAERLIEALGLETRFRGARRGAGPGGLRLPRAGHAR